MRLFGETVPKAVYDDLLKLHRETLETLTRLTETVVSFKRHETGAVEFDPSTLDPMNALGPATQLAIDEFAAGDPSWRNYLVGIAHLRKSDMMSRSDDPNAIDTELAALIRAGDTA